MAQMTVMSYDRQAAGGALGSTVVPELMAPPHLRYVEQRQIRKLLASSLRVGWRRASLINTPGGTALMDVLVPAELFPTWSDVERASAVEELLTRACDARQCQRGEAARIMLGLMPSMFDKSIGFRRSEAGRLLNNTTDATFERRHENNVLEEVAVEAILLAADLPYVEPTQLRLHLVGEAV